jgi:hypothetical protein
MSVPHEQDWDVHGRFVGTVHGLPVNCLYQFRVDDRSGLTEIWVHEEFDDEHQSSVSRSPAIKEMGDYLIQQFHRARRAALQNGAADPVPRNSGIFPVVSLHDYRHRGRTEPADAQGDLGSDRTQERSG